MEHVADADDDRGEVRRRQDVGEEVPEAPEGRRHRVGGEGELAVVRVVRRGEE